MNTTKPRTTPGPRLARCHSPRNQWSSGRHGHCAQVVGGGQPRVANVMTDRYYDLWHAKKKAAKSLHVQFVAPALR